ncbi:MAG: HNH endonuclease [Acidimicrobiia bacterium]
MRGLTPDQIEQALLHEEEAIARSRARQMALLHLADRAQVHTADGCRSLREWTASRLDMSVETAGILTSTAKRLLDAPELARQLIDGEITFDRAVATSRIPTESHDDNLRFHDIAGLRRIAARHKRLSRSSDHVAHQSQNLALQPNLDESSWAVWGQLDGYAGSVVDKVLGEAADELPTLPDGTRPGIGYRRAVALTQLCEGARPDSDTTPIITVFVDGQGVEVAGGSSVGPEILDKVACAGSLEVIGTKDGKPLGMGRRSRVIPKKLRRFVLHRDGGCTADSCNSRYRLQVHHKIPWSEGGATEVDNLVTLCWFHHQVVIHGWGFRIDDSLGAGRLRFIRPDRLPRPGTGPP